jgi:HEAT repeat protein
MKEEMEPEVKKILELIKEKKSEEKVELLESLYDVRLPEDEVNSLCDLITDTDKGVRNSVAYLLVNNANEKVANKIVPYVSSSDISIRNLAGEILLKIGSKAVDAMLEYIDVGDDDEKKFVVDILGLVEDSRANTKITKLLNSNDNENVILACIEALGNLRAEKSLYHIMAFYEVNELYKPTVIETLGKIGSPAALGFIIAKYEEENDDLIKFSIIESLGLIGDEETFFFLLAELNEDKGPLVWPIIKSIYNLKEKFGFDIPFDERMKKIILQTIVDASIEYKKIATNLLLIFNDKETLTVYLRILGEDEEIDQIVSPKFWENPGLVVEIIAEMLNHKPNNIKPLLNLLKDVIQLDGEEKYNSVPSIQLRNLTDALSKYLSDHDEEVRMLSLELLFILDKNVAVLFVDEFSEDNNIWNRLKLVEILDEVIHPKADEVLVKLSNDPEEMIKERASFCLSNRDIKI